jgi:hypothetical protein
MVLIILSRPGTLFRKLFHEVCLNLLYFQEPLPLIPAKMVDLVMQMPYFEFGFEIHPVVILSPQAIL